MKKVISLVLVMICLLANTASAEIKSFSENFSIRSGIRYGMTIAEVKTIEDKNGIECYDPVFSFGHLEYNDISIAGIPNSRLSYSADGFKMDACFSSDSPLTYVENYWDTTQMKMIHYDFGGIQTTEQAKTVFEMMNDSLTQKYDKPFSTSIDSRLLIETSAPILDNFMDSSWRNGRKILGFSEWLAQYEDCYVLISEIAYADSNSATCNLLYRFVSHEEMNSIIDKNQKLMNQMETEMASDL